MTACPPLEQLIQLGEESLGATAFRGLEAHLEECPDCQAAVEHLASVGGSAAETVAPTIPGFVVEGELGRGGMGVAYRAWQVGLERHVALKVIAGGPGARPRDRWLREARLAARVRHPRVVQLHQVGEAEGCLYLVLELVPGGSLKDRLRSPLPPRAAARLLHEIAEAVAAIHDAGLLHLDLKPSNILLDSPADAPWEQASPKVADFGIARLGEELGTTATSLAGPWGTPSYMAPEQVSPHRALLGPATDVYALGALLYELLTGRPPFQAPTVVETLDQVRHREPISPRSLNPGIPRDLETICLACLRKDPAGRYATAEALADDLARWREGRPIGARPTSTLDHACRWCQRRPLPAALLGALAVTLVSGYLVLTALWARSETARKAAEANHRVASHSLNELIRLARRNRPDDLIQKAEATRLEATLVQARAQEAELQKANPGGAESQRRLAAIDGLLGHLYLLAGRREQARSALQESIDLWDVGLRDATDTAEARNQQMQSVGDLMTIIDLSPADEYDRWSEKSVAVAQQVSPALRRVEAVLYLGSLRRNHAFALSQIGEHDRSRRILEADLRLVDDLPASGPWAPLRALCRALTLEALGKWDGDLEPIRAVGRMGPLSEGLVQQRNRAVTELVARRLGWRRWDGVPTVLIGRDESAGAWAARVIDTVRAVCETMGLESRAVPQAVWSLDGYLASAASQHRSARRLDDARRTAGHTHVVADRLAQLYPTHSGSFKLLSEAYNQKAKNAWKLDDRVAVERFYRLALEASRRALSLDPEDDEARRLVDDRRRRLDDLIAPPRASPLNSPTARAGP